MLNVVNKVRYRPVMKDTELATFVALFDLSVQQGSITRAKVNIINKCTQNKPETQDEFIRIVVKERGKLASSRWRADCISRRIGILNKKKTSITESVHTAERNNDNFGIIKEKYVCGL